jgi:hypothetical protein
MTRVRGHNSMDQAISARPNIAQGPYYYATLFFATLTYVTITLGHSHVHLNSLASHSATKKRTSNNTRRALVVPPFSPV